MPLEGSTGVEGFQRRLYGAARAGDLVLVNDQRCGVEPGDMRRDQVALMPDHQGQLAGVDGAGGAEGVADQRKAADFVENLGGPGFHPGTGTCS